METQSYVKRNGGSHWREKTRKEPVKMSPESYLSGRNIFSDKRNQNIQIHFNRLSKI